MDTLIAKITNKTSVAIFTFSALILIISGVLGLLYFIFYRNIFLIVGCIFSFISLSLMFIYILFILISANLKIRFFNKSELEKIIEYLTEKYLFSWDEIPGNDDKRLIHFLKDDLRIEWAKTENISKIDGGKTIIVSNKEKSISLKINDEKTKVNLKIDDVRVDEFTVKTENGKLNIYAEGRVHELRNTNSER